MEISLEVKIEGVLFYKAEPMKKTALVELFGVSLSEIESALLTLENQLTTGGTRLIVTDTSVQLVTASQISETIQTLRKEELSHDIGRAGAETLAIIFYRGPLSRVEIDSIRGVNSTFILRNLLVRGLIERREHPTDTRSFVYAVAPTLMNHLGITKREELPEFQNVMDALDLFEKSEQILEQESHTRTQ